MESRITTSQQMLNHANNVLTDIKRKISIDKNFICPITRQLITEPVTVNNINYDVLAYTIKVGEERLEHIIANETLKQEINKLIQSWLLHIEKLNQEKTDKKFYLCQSVQEFFKIASDPNLDFSDIFYLETFLNAIDLHGRNVLQVAINAGNLAFAKFLLAENSIIDFNYKDFQGRTLLHHAAIGKITDNEILDLFLKKIELTKDKQFNSPLHYAAQFDNEILVQLLLENSADIQSKNGLGKRPIELTEPQSNSHTLLLNHMMNVYKTRKNSEQQDEEKDNLILINEINKLRDEVKTLHCLNNELLQYINDLTPSLRYFVTLESKELQQLKPLQVMEAGSSSFFKKTNNHDENNVFRCIKCY